MTGEHDMVENHPPAKTTLSFTIKPSVNRNIVPRLSQTTSRLACRFYAQGFCAAGPACSYVHEEQQTLKLGAGLKHQSSVETISRELSQLEVASDATFSGRSHAQPKFGSISFAKSAALSNGSSSTTVPKPSSFSSTWATPNLSLRKPILTASSSSSSSSSANPQSIYAFFPKSDELCAFAIVGKCRYGEMCRNIHGLQCPRCFRYCLYPNDVDKNEQHLEECLSKDQSTCVGPIDVNSIECGICMEKVTLKEDPRFGLMNCDHAFCLACIRTWRSRHSMSDLATKSCPLCRTITYFIIPSSTWTTDRAEKEKIIESYKNKCADIDCKHHNYGNGDCPFGSSCFYAHRGRDGLNSRLPMRSYVDKDEKIRMIRETKLSDFVEFAFKSNGRQSKGGNKNK